MPAFHSQIILTVALFKKGVPLAFLGLVSQTMAVLLGLTFSTDLKHHWLSLPPKPDSLSFLTWFISLLKTQLFLLFNILSLHHLRGRLPFILQLNCHSVTWNNSLSSRVSQIQSQLPHKTILCREVRPLEFKGSKTTRSPSNMCSAEPEPVGPTSTPYLLIPEFLFPSFLQDVWEIFIDFQLLEDLNIWMFK